MTRPGWMIRWGPCILLLVLTFTALWRVTPCSFVNYDDPVYVTENPHVQKGITGESLRWAFTSTYAANWHPLTWVSHMLDWRIWGAHSFGHHLTSLLLHALSSLLLFTALRRMTGKSAPSALAAALFAIHPMHVESVAWVSERKDVLAGFFMMVSMGAYAGYVTGRSRWVYWLTLGCFALGLVCKPTIVTLPFLLLLLDWWPLGRFNRENAGRLLLEKLPFLVVSMGSCLITLYAQRAGGAAASFTALPFSRRVANAVLTYVLQLKEAVWPGGMAVFYPLPRVEPPLAVTLGAAALLIAFSAAALAAGRRRPWIAVGWLWYVAALVPMVGIVQVGSQARADRYTYLPYIGLFFIVAWGAAEIAGRSKAHARTVAAGVCVWVAALSVVTWQQTEVWSNSRTLFEHALAVTGENAVAHNQLGLALASDGDTQSAIRHYQDSLRIDPSYPDPGNNLGVLLEGQGRLPEAEQSFRRTLAVRPDYTWARNNLALALLKQGRSREAVDELYRVTRERPDWAEAENNMGDALVADGSPDSAISHYRTASRLAPDWALPLNNLAWTLSTSPSPDVLNPEEALRAGREAARLSGDDPAVLDTLAAAYASAGDFEQAISTARRAIERLSQDKRGELAKQIQTRLRLYQHGKPFRERPSGLTGRP